MGEAETEVDPLEATALFAPPNIEIAIGQFEDGEGEEVPLFFDGDRDDDVVVASPFSDIDHDDGKEGHVEDEGPVFFEAGGEFEEADGVAGGQVHFAEDGGGFGAAIAFALDIIHYDVMQLGGKDGGEAQQERQKVAPHGGLGIKQLKLIPSIGCQ